MQGADLLSNILSIATVFTGSRPRDNYIRVYFGNASGNGTPNSDATDDQIIGNPRGDVNWPQDNVADTVAANDFLQLVQWDVVNPAFRSPAILSDDNDGSRHQRFILRLDSGQTLLIAHNIDLAPRVSSLSEGDGIAFYGVYEWNPKGGVIHWTHHDPNNHHVTGWLQHNGKTYQ